MKRMAVTSIAAVLALALASAVLAGGPGKAVTARGTITSIQVDARTLTLKDAAGHETRIAWNDATRMTGTPEEGASATVRYVKQGDRMVALEITVETGK
jgi:hypothetical protein